MALVNWDRQTRALFKALNSVETADLYAITTANAAVTFDVLANSSDQAKPGEASQKTESSSGTPTAPTTD